MSLNIYLVQETHDNYCENCFVIITNRKILADIIIITWTCCEWHTSVVFSKQCVSFFTLTALAFDIHCYRLNQYIPTRIIIFQMTKLGISYQVGIPIWRAWEGLVAGEWEMGLVGQDSSTTQWMWARHMWMNGIQYTNMYGFKSEYILHTWEHFISVYYTCFHNFKINIPSFWQTETVPLYAQMLLTMSNIWIKNHVNIEKYTVSIFVIQKLH